MNGLRLMTGPKSAVFFRTRNKLEINSPGQCRALTIAPFSSNFKTSLLIAWRLPSEKNSIAKAAQVDKVRSRIRDYNLQHTVESKDPR